MTTRKNKTNPTQTILVIVLGFLILFLVMSWRWTLYVAIVIGILGLLSPYLAKKIDYAWMKFAWLLSLIIPNVLLSIVFFFLLTPIAFLSRLIRKEDPLRLKNNNASLFKDSNKVFDKESFDNPW